MLAPKPRVSYRPVSRLIQIAESLRSATFVLSTIGSQSVSGRARGALVLIIGDAAGLQNEIRYLNATAVMDI